MKIDIAVMATILILTILSGFKFFYLDGSLHPFEPDEFIYATVAKNLNNSRIPTYEDAPFFDHLPMLAILANGLERLPFFPHDLFFYFLSVRIISIVVNLFTSLVLLYYFNRWGERKLGILAAFIFQLLPLNLTYPRLGLTYPLATFWIISFILTWLEAYFRKSIWQLVLSGFFFGGAIFSNYISLIYIPFPFFAILITHLLNQRFHKTFSLNQISTLFWLTVPILIGVSTVFFLLIFLYGPVVISYLENGLRTIFGVQASTKANQITPVFYLLKNFFYFFNPFLGLHAVLTLMGSIFYYLTKEYRPFSINGSNGIYLTAFFGLSLFYSLLWFFVAKPAGRYYYPLGPFLAILAAYSVIKIWELVIQNNWKRGLIYLATGGLLIVPQLKTAYFCLLSYTLLGSTKKHFCRPTCWH